MNLLFVACYLFKDYKHVLAATEELNDWKIQKSIMEILSRGCTEAIKHPTLPCDLLFGPKFCSIQNGMFPP